MSRIVFCRKHQKDLEGLDAPPYPGAKGQDIYDNISKQAWQEWQQHQTMLINERGLNMVDPEARKFLKEQMDKFMTGQEYAQADGFVPENK